MFPSNPGAHITEGVGIVLVVLGLIAALAGDWMIVVRAYRHGAFCFLACLLVPLAGWGYAAFSMPRARVPLSLSLGGAAAGILGWLFLQPGG